MASQKRIGPSRHEMMLLSGLRLYRPEMVGLPIRVVECPNVLPDLRHTLCQHSLAASDFAIGDDDGAEANGILRLRLSGLVVPQTSGIAIFKFGKRHAPPMEEQPLTADYRSR